MFAECTETVSILYAVVFGAGDACVLISMSSILTALGAFLVLVLIAQFIARRLWAHVRAPREVIAQEPTETVERGAIIDDPNYSNSAIRTSKR